MELWNVDDIIPYEKNPRRNDDAVKFVANSIREFGFNDPIVINGEGVVLAGHTRLKAAKSLGMKQVPVYVRTDMTPEQEKAFRPYFATAQRISCSPTSVSMESCPVWSASGSL